MSDNFIQDEIKRLFLENEQLRLQNEQLNSAINDIYGNVSTLVGMVKANMDAVTSCGNAINQLQGYISMVENIAHNTKYEICDILGQNIFFKPKFRSNEETLHLIIDEGKSLARFGDGEFSIAGNLIRHKFQKLDEKLAARIKQVLVCQNDNLLVAIADNYGSLEKYTEDAADAIRHYMAGGTRALHESLLDKEKVYSDAYITRTYVMYKDNLTDAPRKRFDTLKKIWENKNIIIVEGSQTRLGVGNDLFANTKSIRRILAPPTSSFDRYDEILDASLKVADSTDIFILAIGPSSGVLAYDLTLEGIQAVDVGHIDLEYEWMLAGKGMRVPVPGKYNNEVPGGDAVEEIKDQNYISQIIFDFSN